MKAIIEKHGNSLGVKLSKHLLKSAGIGEHDSVEVIVENNAIIIKRIDVEIRKSIKERFKGFNGTYDIEMFDSGGPVWDL